MDFSRIIRERGSYIGGVFRIYSANVLMRDQRDSALHAE